MDKETKQMFELILNKLDSMGIKQDSMENKLDCMEKKQDSMGKRQDSMARRQDEIFEVVKAIEHNNKVHKSEISIIQYKIAHV